MASDQSLIDFARKKQEEQDGTDLPGTTGDEDVDSLLRFSRAAQIQTAGFERDAEVQAAENYSVPGALFEALLESDAIVNAISFGKVDVNELPDPIQFAADTLLSPVGIASVVAAPFTGGGSVVAAAGARGTARATLATVGRIALREVAIDAVGSSSVRILDATGALDQLDQIHPALAVGASFAVGIGAGAGAHRALSNHAWMRTAAEQERAAASALVDEVRKLADQRYNFGVVTLDHGRAGVGELLEDPGFIRRLSIRLKGLGVDNTAEFRQSKAGIEIAAMARAEEILDNMASANAVKVFGRAENLFERVNPRVIDETPLFRLTTKTGDVVEDANLVDLVRKGSDEWTKFDLSPQQLEYLERSRAYFAELNDYMNEIGLLKTLGIKDVHEMSDLYISQVALARNGELFDKTINPFVERVIDTVEAGRGSGIEYAGLTETAIFMQQFANKFDLDAQFRTAMDDLLVDPEHVLFASNPAWRAAKEKLDEINDIIKGAEPGKDEAYLAWRTLRDSLDEAGEEATTAAQRNRLNSLRAEYDVKQAEITAMRKQRQGVRDKLSDMLANEKLKTSIDSQFWGQPKGTPIPVGLWQGKFIKDIDMAAMRQWLQGQGLAQLKPDEGFGVAAREIGNMARFFSATLDLSAPFIHGLPMLFTEPKAWGASVHQMFRSIANDPLTIRQQFLNKKWDTVREMILEGEVPFGDVEIFNSLRSNNRSALATLTQRTVESNRVSSGAFRKTADAYDTMLLVGRTEVYESLRMGAGFTPQQAGTVVRNMTGALSSRRLGLPPTLRNFESIILFSPRLVRSTIAMAASGLTKPHTVEGALQLRATMKTVAGMMALTVAANVGIAALTGKSTEELFADLQDHLDPLSGGDFLSVEIPGIDVKFGIGGQVRALVQAVGQAISNPSGINDWSQNDNPFLGFVAGRKSPLANTGLGFMEMITGEELNILPFEEVDGPLDFMKLTASSFVPFAASAAFEDGNLQQRLTSMGGEFFATRTSPLTPFDEREQLVQDTFGGLHKWEELSDEDRKDIYNKRPGLEERIDKFFRDAPQVERNKAERDSANTQASAAIKYALEGRLTRMDRGGFREEIDKILAERAARMASIGNLDPREFDNDSIRSQVLTAYFETWEQARELAEAGIHSPIDYDMQSDLESKLIADIQSGAYGDPQTALRILEGRLGFIDGIEEIDWYFDNKDTIRESGYWDIPDVILENTFRDQLPSGIRDYSDLLVALRTAEVNGNTSAVRDLERIKKRIDSRADVEKKRLRRENASLETALFENGYITKIRNNEVRKNINSLR